MKLIQHLLSQAFPEMSADDFEKLKDHIETHGQRQLIVLEGMVLDNRHR